MRELVKGREATDERVVEESGLAVGDRENKGGFE